MGLEIYGRGWAKFRPKSKSLCSKMIYTSRRIRCSQNQSSAVFRSRDRLLGLDGPSGPKVHLGNGSSQSFDFGCIWFVSKSRSFYCINFLIFGENGPTTPINLKAYFGPKKPVLGLKWAQNFKLLFSILSYRLDYITPKIWAQKLLI